MCFASSFDRQIMNVMKQDADVAIAPELPAAPESSDLPMAKDSSSDSQVSAASMFATSNKQAGSTSENLCNDMQ